MPNPKRNKKQRVGDNVQKGKGEGFISRKDTILMTRCFECGIENWAPTVSSGMCAWCGFNPNIKKVITTK